MACASVTCSLLGLHFPLRASHAWISSTDLTLGQLSWVSAEQAQGPPLVGGGGEELGGCSCVGFRGYPSVNGAYQVIPSLRPWHYSPTLFGTLVTTGQPSWPPYSSHGLPLPRPHLLVALASLSPGSSLLLLPFSTMTRETNGPAWRHNRPSPEVAWLVARWTHVNICGLSGCERQGQRPEIPSPTLTHVPPYIREVLM